MSIPIELSPGKLDQPKYNFGKPQGLSEAVSAEFTEALGRVIAEELVRPTFEGVQIETEFHRSIDRIAPEVFQSRLAYEKKWESGRGPVHVMLGQLATKDCNISVSEVVPSSEFIEGLHREVDNYGAEIGNLKRLHDAWPSGVFEYLSALDTVSQDSKQNIDAAFDIVRKMSENVEHITLAPDHPEGLLMIPHLPGGVRRFTRRLLVGSHVAARVDRALGESKTPEEERMITNLQKYYILDNLHGQHWESGSSLSEENQVQVAYNSAEQLATLIELQEATDLDAGQRFKEVWWRETQELNDEVRAEYGELGLSQWQQIDIGHAFEGCTSIDLMRAFRQGWFSGMPHGLLEMRPAKGELRALILEDDNQQRRVWRETVNRSTSYNVEDNLTFASPEGIDELIDDPTIGLFLLDIQNGDDLSAGIRIGKEVLRRRYDRLSQQVANGENPSKTKIIIWSASADALEQAKNHFKPLEEDHYMPGVSYSTPSMMRGTRNDPIKVEIRPKTFRTYADIE